MHGEICVKYRLGVDKINERFFETYQHDSCSPEGKRRISRKNEEFFLKIQGHFLPFF